jgi:hypothetical protein
LSFAPKAKLSGLRCLTIIGTEGYVSTSLAEQVAIDLFLVKRVFAGSAPTLLEFRLPKGFNVLEVSRGHEFELLIGRDREFLIVDASEFKHPGVWDPILRLVLIPALNSASHSTLKAV